MKRLILILILCCQVQAANWYVSTAGDNSNGETPATAWTTFAGIDWTGSGVQPGDTLYVIGTMEESLTVGGSGSDGSPITIRGDADGETAGTIEGATLITPGTSWTDDAQANTWTATVTTEPTQIFFNGTRGILAANKAAVNAEFEWFWAANELAVFSPGDVDVDTAYTSPGIEVSIVGSVGLIVITARDYIVFENLTIQRSQQRGLAGNVSSGNLTMRGLTVLSCFLHNLQPGGKTGAGNNLIENCDVSFAGHTGIDINSPNAIIRNCVVHFNGVDHQDSTAGLHAYGGGGIEGIVIEDNIFHNNGAAKIGGVISPSGQTAAMGIWIDGRDATTPGYKTANTFIRRNTIFESVASGIFLEQCDFVEVTNNVIYDIDRTSVANGGVAGVYGAGIVVKSGVHSNKVLNNTLNNCDIGITVEGDGTAGNITDNEITNNIIVNYANRFLEAKNGGENDGTNGSGNLYLNNCVDTETVKYKWGGVDKTTLAQFNIDYGSDSGSINADPLFVDAAGNDFHLTSGSECIGKGTNVSNSYGTDFGGIAVSVPLDIGAHTFIRRGRNPYKR